jgi:hypothetical protein
MTYTLRFLPDVEEDVMVGYTWYEEKAPGLGRWVFVPLGGLTHD